MVSTPISGNAGARPVATSEVQTLNDQISNLNLEIQRLIQQSTMIRDQIGGLRDAIKAERNNRPQHPGADALNRAVSEYRSALEASDARIAGFEDKRSPSSTIKSAFPRCGQRGTNSRSRISEGQCGST